MLLSTRAGAFPRAVARPQVERRRLARSFVREEQSVERKAEVGRSAHGPEGRWEPVLRSAVTVTCGRRGHSRPTGGQNDARTRGRTRLCVRRVVLQGSWFSRFLQQMVMDSTGPGPLGAPHTRDRPHGPEPPSATMEIAVPSWVPCRGWVPHGLQQTGDWRVTTGTCPPAS